MIQAGNTNKQRAPKGSPADGLIRPQQQPQLLQPQLFSQQPPQVLPQPQP